MARRIDVPRFYQLIPVSVEAIQLSAENVERAATWSGGIQVIEYDAIDKTRTFVALNIPTVFGVVRVSEGDYIVKDQKGHFSTMSAAQFESKYEAI
jgi:hypothetical protein